MTYPVIQIVNAETGETTVREMTENEYLQHQSNIVPVQIEQTKEELLVELQALTAKITALVS